MTRPVAHPGTDDLLGHAKTCARLWRAIERDRLHHCYLFEGPAGVGKRTVAQRFAMAENCESVGPALLGPPPPRPCGHCLPCRQIAAGNHPDVLEVERDPTKKAAVISAGQARELIRKLSLHRHSARRRFVIIDPADILRPEAANALLKTFEEPPDATIFVLVTSRATALLPTVLSRCVRVRFQPVPKAEMISWLDGRGVEGSEHIARLANGSPGRALSLADGEAAAMASTRTQVLDALAGGTTAVLQYAEALVKGGKREIVGPRVDRVMCTLQTLLRDAVVMGGDREAYATYGVEDVPARRWAKALWPTGVSAVEDALCEADRQLSLFIGPRLVVGALLARVQRELGPEGTRLG